MKKLILALLIVGCGIHSTQPLAQQSPVQRNFALVYEQLMEKYGVLPRSTCQTLDLTSTTQSVLCESTPQIAVWCVAASGQKPRCELAIDLRPPQPQKEGEKPLPPAASAPTAVPPKKH